tara:strand:+ start:2697 stop:3224 length:528 start_codon:yes stop_codon:yes gene_type:complete
MSDKILANIVIELLGRPKEHLQEAMETHIVKLGSEKGVSIKNKTIHPAVEAQDSKTLFTTFAEVEVEFDSIENYLGIIFAYLPANIEIIKPENLSLSNAHFNDLGNMILQRVHNYDAVAKNMIAEREYLINILKTEAPELYDKLLKAAEAGNQPAEQAKTKEKKPKKKTKKSKKK